MLYVQISGSYFKKAFLVLKQQVSFMFFSNLQKQSNDPSPKYIYLANGETVMPQYYLVARQEKNVTSTWMFKKAKLRTIKNSLSKNNYKI